MFYKLLVLFLVLAFSSSALAERLKPRAPNTRSLTNSSGSDSFDFSVSAAFTDIIAAGADSDLYDPITIGELRILKERAQPSWAKDEIDPDETRLIGEKALAIQTTNSLLPLIKSSEIGYYISQLESGYRYLTGLLRLKLSDTGEALKFSRENKGHTIAELNIKMSFSDGLDPQVRLSDNVRMRYDWREQASFLEYAQDF